MLINNFGEICSADTLLDKIRTERVKTTIEDYYSSISNLLSRINNSYLLENAQNDQQVIASNNRIALDAFKNNLPEPAKTIVLSRNPQSLNEAYKIIREVNQQSLGPNASAQNFRNRYQNSSYREFHNLLTRNNNFNSSSSRNNNTYNSLPRGDQIRQVNNYTPRQNQNNSQSDQSRQNINYTQSGQSRQTNRYRQRNNLEPMDIILNERRTHNQLPPQNRKFFLINQRNNYHI